MNPKVDGFYATIWLKGLPDVRAWIRRDQVVFICETPMTDATVIGLSNGRLLKIKQSFEEVHELVFNGGLEE